MRRALRLTLLLAVVTAFPLPSAAAPSSTFPVQEHRDVVAAFHDALEAGDGDEALSHLAPDVVIFESGGAERSRDEYASHHLAGDMRFAGLTDRQVIDQRVNDLGETAVVMTWTRTTGALGERQIDSNGVETMVLRQFEGQWRIVHIHWSSRSNER